MCEVLNIVGKVIGRPLYLKIDTAPSNTSHFSYRKSCPPGATGSQPTSKRESTGRETTRLLD